MAALVASLGLAPAFSQAADPRIDQLFSQWDKPDSPGCSLAVAQAGTIVYSRGYGTADLDHGIPNTPTTVFHAASLSKQFTAMSIMLLVNRGLLKLDDNVSDYCPRASEFRRKADHDFRYASPHQRYQGPGGVGHDGGLAAVRRRGDPG